MKKIERSEPMFFGVIDEDHFTLYSPRAIDEGPWESMSAAMAEAAVRIENGTEQVSIVRCRFSKRHQCWVEIVDGSCITISATDTDAWFGEEEEAPAAATGVGR
jgi:hypothetical protein